MSNSSEDVASWRAFMAEPVAYTESTRLAACFGGASAELGKQLQESARLQKRLSALITARYGLPAWVEPENCEEPDRSIALLPADQFLAIVRRSGAIYWSSAIASAVLTKDVKALQDAVGAQLCAFAIKHRDLAGPEQALQPFETLTSRIADDGWRCFSAWCDKLPAGIGSRVRLKLPASPLLDTQAASPFDERGPAIVRRAASQ